MAEILNTEPERMMEWPHKTILIFKMWVWSGRANSDWSSRHVKYVTDDSSFKVSTPAYELLRDYPDSVHTLYELEQIELKHEDQRKNRESDQYYL